MFRSASAAALAAAVVLSAPSCGRLAGSSARSTPSAAVQRAFTARLDSLAAASVALTTAIDRLPGDSLAQHRARDAFRNARAAYKRTEFLLEYYDTESAHALNGAPIDEVEVEDGPAAIEPAKGFQVLEALLFPSVDTSALSDIRREVAVIRDYTTRARGIAPTIAVTDENLFDALRIEVARIVALGITGFDSPVARASLTEARAAFSGMHEAMGLYSRELQRRDRGIVREINALFDAADHELADRSFDAFDRLTFIVNTANPLARSIARARDLLDIRIPPDPRLWRARAATMFDVDAFDSEFLRPAWSPPSTRARVALGKRLFFDPLLSGNGSRSCAFCHQPERAFTDGRATSAALNSRVLRNAPTLVNAALQGAQFTDMRAVYLEDQVTAVVQNAAEMHGTLDIVAARLRMDREYVSAFTAAFEPSSMDSAVTPLRVRVAIAAFIRSLGRLHSRADDALRGDGRALDPEERLGFNVFAGKGACATCHFLPLTNGTVPPTFTKTEQEVIGVPAMPKWLRARVDPDSGRAVVTRAAQHRFAFKTPTLRNVAVTAPYMHNGVYRTLEEVVRFYDGGGGHGIGVNLPNQTLSTDSLRLTMVETAALVRFLNALTDTSGLPARK